MQRAAMRQNQTETEKGRNMWAEKETHVCAHTHACTDTHKCTCTHAQGGGCLRSWRGERRARGARNSPGEAAGAHVALPTSPCFFPGSPYRGSDSLRPQPWGRGCVPSRQMEKVRPSLIRLCPPVSLYPPSWRQWVGAVFGGWGVHFITDPSSCCPNNNNDTLIITTKRSLM